MINSDKRLDYILKELVTKKEVDDFSIQLKSLEDMLFELRGDFWEKVEECLSRQMVKAVREYFADKEVDVSDMMLMREEVSKIRVKLKTLPELNIVLAREMPQLVLLKMRQWVFANIEKYVVLELTIDPQILGGVMFLYKGTYYDFSLRKELEQMGDRGELKLSSLFAESMS